MSTRKIAIRADASPHIGTGHVIRCLTLADELARHDAKVAFICRNIPPTLQTMVRQRGHDLHLLPDVSQSNVNAELAHAEHLDTSWDIDAQQTLHALDADGGADWLILDHYALDARWERAARPGAENIMVIDDLMDRPHDCELLLDQTLGRQPPDYANLIPQGTQLLLGPQYALIRPQFRRLRPSALRRRAENGSLRRILVSFGGNDLHGLTTVALRAINRSAQKATVEVALGTENPQAMCLTDMACEMTQEIIFHDFSSDMARLMHDADLAIGAAGTSSWERCCLGLPTVILILADNQREGAMALQKAGAATATEADTEPQKLLQILARQLDELRQDASRCLAIAQAAASVTDGLGAPLAALELAPERTRDGKFLTFAPLSMAYSGLILGWQREPCMRKYSRSPAPPSEQEHTDWMKQTLSDNKRMAWIMEVDHNPAGLLRLDRVAEGESEVSILVPQQHQGNGIALSALRILRRMLPWPEFMATVHRQNLASRRLFEKAGYVMEQQEGHNNDFLTLRQRGENHT